MVMDRRALMRWREQRKLVCDRWRWKEKMMRVFGEINFLWSADETKETNHPPWWVAISSNCRKEAWKNLCFHGIQTRASQTLNRCCYPLSSEATGGWEATSWRVPCFCSKNYNRTSEALRSIHFLNYSSVTSPEKLQFDSSYFYNYHSILAVTTCRLQKWND